MWCLNDKTGCHRSYKSSYVVKRVEAVVWRVLNTPIERNNAPYLATSDLSRNRVQTCSVRVTKKVAGLCPPYALGEDYPGLCIY